MDEDDLKKKMASSKGVGNFRSMFVNIPNGNEKGIQLIPVADIATKDEFENIKNITAQEVLTGHRFPAELAAIEFHKNKTEINLLPRMRRCVRGVFFTWGLSRVRSAPCPF